MRYVYGITSALLAGGTALALVTLALSEVTRLIIVGLRDHTGGSLGLTPKPALTDGATANLAALQFEDKTVWFYAVLVLWLLALWVWHRVDGSMNRLALEAISEEEDAAASIGIDVTRAKLTVTLISAAMTCIGGLHELCVGVPDLAARPAAVRTPAHATGAAWGYGRELFGAFRDASAHARPWSRPRGSAAPSRWRPRLNRSALWD